MIGRKKTSNLLERFHWLKSVVPEFCSSREVFDWKFQLKNDHRWKAVKIMFFKKLQYIACIQCIEFLKTFLVKHFRLPQFQGSKVAYIRSPRSELTLRSQVIIKLRHSVKPGCNCRAGKLLSLLLCSILNEKLALLKLKRIGNSICVKLIFK